MRWVVLTVDYEIFGNGAGDVRQHVTDPTERMARLCSRHQMPLTVFLETEEYLAFDRHSAQLRQALGYDPAGLIRAQIQALARDGHDIQLHLHPQWHNARWEDGQWALREEKETVDSLFDTQAEVTAYIAERKRVIDEMLAEAGSGKTVQVYRAGAFSAQPGAKLLKALADTGITIDSSVVKGLTRRSEHGGLDYREAPDAKGPWRVSTEVAQEDRAGSVWEFPIYAVMGRRWQQITWRRLKAKFSGNVPKLQQKKLVRQLGVSRNPFRLVPFLAAPVPIKFDFHNLVPASLLRWIRTAPKPTDGLPDVLVAIGHTKEHIDDRSFERFVSLLAREPDVKVVGFSEVAELMKSYRGQTGAAGAVTSRA